MEWQAQEAGFMQHWRKWVEDEVASYCAEHELKAPNRTTTVQPAGTKSLLTGASSGWHPPKAQRFIRRITVGKAEPVAMAALDMGYNVIPAQSARDDEGNLLNDIWDSRAQEWLIEIPTEVPWARKPGADEFDLSKLPIAAQWGLYMQVQTHYTTHNTSATLEITEEEISELSELIYGAILRDEGYISAAVLARFDATGGTFPRLPFEPISKERYEEELYAVQARRAADGGFHEALLARDDGRELEQSSSACSNAACVAAADKAEARG
jgi:ribonucleotide reductase class II